MPKCECGAEYPDYYTPPIHCSCGAKLSFIQLDRPTPPPGNRRAAATGRTARRSPSGSDAWDELHHYAVARWSGSEDARLFYAGWEDRLRRILGCSFCVQEWRRITRRFRPDFSSCCAMFGWSWKAHNEVNRRLGKRIFPLEEARRRYRTCADGSLVTWDDFTRDTEVLAARIIQDHPRLSGVAGCPRSGMRAATDIALRLGVNLYAADDQRGLVPLSGGLRMRGVDGLHGPMAEIGDGPVVLVEDSVCSGTSLQRMRGHPQMSSIPAYAVYAASPGRSMLSGFAVMLDLPHWFEWNIWHNGVILRGDFGTDWDGVLNDDCPAEFDDDGPLYRRWLRSVPPKRIPNRYKIPWIITGRREPYREICVEWLDRYGIQYGELIMYPHSFEQRKKDVAAWKAKQIDRLKCAIFVESDPGQAAILRVFCRPEVHILCTGIQS